MERAKYSIWRGNGIFVWALAAICLGLTEALFLYVRVWKDSVSLWSMSALYIPIMVTLPFSTGVSFYRKFTKLSEILNNNAMVDSCSLYVASMVLV
jgi:hypothetical protein